MIAVSASYGPVIRHATRERMRELGREWGTEAGRLLAEHVLASEGVDPPDLTAARTAITLQALADAAERFRALGCRDRQVRAFRDAAVPAVAAALDTAMSTVAATGRAN